MMPRAMPRIFADVLSNASLERVLLRNAIRLGIFAAILAGLIQPAAAQRYDGKNSTPSVTIDYSVLDELGRAPNVPQLILQNPTGSAYRNNPYRSGAKFPIVSKSKNRLGNKRLVLTPPTTVNRRASRKPTRKAIRRTKRTTRNKVVRRTPTRKLPPVTKAPRRLASPPPPSILKTPTAIAPPPPPKIAPAKRRKIAKAPAVKVVPTPPKAPEPPPLPPASTAPKTKQKIARSVAPPPPAPAKSAILPPPIPRRVEVSRPSASQVVPKARPVRAAPVMPKQIVSLPRSTASVRSGSLRRIEFPRGSAKLSNKASLGLENVAAALSEDAGLRIQLLAYAGQIGDSPSQARRLSLSRALAARSKLIEQGVRSTRIDVRALGNKSAGGPADRIDIIVTKR